MAEGSHPHPDTPNSSDAGKRDEDTFYTRAYSRMMVCMLVAAALATPLFLWRPGTNFALGFLLGSALALLNFRWLERTVATLSEAVIRSAAPQRSGRVVRRFLLRYFLIALCAYVIFKVSATAVYGFFAGLSLPVLGIICEAVYEAVMPFKPRSE